MAIIADIYFLEKKGPKKQDFRPKIDILKRNHSILWIQRPIDKIKKCQMLSFKVHQESSDSF